VEVPLVARYDRLFDESSRRAVHVGGGVRHLVQISAEEASMMTLGDNDVSDGVVVLASPSHVEALACSLKRLQLLVRDLLDLRVRGTVTVDDDV
ncbi:hypothetical protein PMAYCL1PPCAC_26928, partial [Pristionchus mayeri]